MADSLYKYLKDRQQSNGDLLPKELLYIESIDHIRGVGINVVVRRQCFVSVADAEKIYAALNPHIDESRVTTG